MQYDFIESVRNVLMNKGLSLEESKEIIKENPKIFNYLPEQINKKLSVIFNENGAYAIIFCDNNECYWSTKALGHFGKLFIANPKADYIVGTILENLNRDKLNIYSSSNNTLEEKMIIYKDISNGAPGYNIK